MVRGGIFDVFELQDMEAITVEIRNILASFFGDYADAFYIEAIAIDEITILRDGKAVPDTSGILRAFMGADDKRTILNTVRGFVFYISGNSYVMDFSNYITTNTNLCPKVTIAKKGTGFDIRLFMKHD
ncbi:hypothetical protein NO263_09250 [Gluconacetobacter entanii]|uniref:Uncharacterized protein n=1 Tax=Gluconacetobacter entanii TaxID=108528 RepID=A0ABT3K6R8_9PROT|nr:hypothetical protein [Gluconacetobacter entanii]MCW4590767.1 hypothetical protein [Gluconacetobacter entanii]